jgi:lactoylglutathione lyase
MNHLSHITANCIDHIKMDVLDMEETIRFYIDIFGFIVYEEDPNISIIGNKNIKLCLYNSPNIRHGSIEHFGFHVSDFSKVLNFLDKKGISYILSDWEYSTSAYVLDPNGYRIELSEHIGGGHDMSNDQKEDYIQKFGKKEAAPYAKRLSPQPEMKIFDLGEEF